MQLPKPLHDWHMTAGEAIALQKQLTSKLELTRPPETAFNLVAGLDAAFSRDGKTCIAAVVLWDRAKQSVIEQHIATHPVLFPYIPGLLSFREAPALLNALRLLTNVPDVLMCDGQGIAHPRRLGIASHVGLFTDLPALGCGKSRLIGTHAEPGQYRGDQTPLLFKGEVVGHVVRSKNNVRPLYVSPGHRMDLETAVELVLTCDRGYRLPEPTRLADRLVASAR